jgi:aminoglycoside phosphotransferase (APT) family kinase protein
MLHKVDCSNLDVSFLPLQEKKVAEKLGKRPVKVDESLDEGRIRDTLEAVWPLPQRNLSVLHHGDFWPGNILWLDGQIVGVIDWEDAALGDPLADVANSRLEMLWAFGIDAMQSFTHYYQSITSIDFTNLPYWDLYAALRPISQIAEWGLDDIAEKTMRERHRWFVAQAFKWMSDHS